MLAAAHGFFICTERGIYLDMRAAARGHWYNR
jgi:hypothetical protein